MANREERIVFPSFCIYSFHIPYRRAIIFEKAFSQRENSTPSSFEDRKSSSNDVATHAFVAFPILSPVFDGAWRTKAIDLEIHSVTHRRSHILDFSYHSFTLTYLQQKRNRSQFERRNKTIRCKFFGILSIFVGKVNLDEGEKFNKNNYRTTFIAIDKTTRWSHQQTSRSVIQKKKKNISFST